MKLILQDVKSTDKRINTYTEQLETIVVCSEHLLTIISDLLDLSKIEAGKMLLETQILDLEKCIRQAFLLNESLRKKLGRSKSVELSWRVEDNVPKMIVGDPTRLRQVLVNLIHNAIKFTSKGHILLRVRKVEKEELERLHPMLSPQSSKAHRPPSGADNDNSFLNLQEECLTENNDDKEVVHLEFAVEDTGVGISSRNLNYIFDAFAQVYY